MGFRLTERNLKRAGCDYWDDVEIVHWPSVEAFLSEHSKDEIWLFTGSTDKLYTDVDFGEETFLLFGRESRGIDQDILDRYSDRCLRIPMRQGLRSLNLSNAVAIGAYEFVRQLGL